jgi:hypothetical protein
MTALSRLEQAPPADLVRYGTLMLAAHVTLLLAGRALTFTVGARPAAALAFWLDAATGLLLEVSLFCVGWLYITALAVALGGREESRRLFGWLGLCFAPAVCCSLIGCATLLSGPGSLDSGQALRVGSAISYLLSAALAAEMTHRVCGVKRPRAVVIVGSYVGLLLAADRAAG